MEHCASTTGCRGASCATDDVPWSLSAKVVMPSKKDSTPCWRTTMSLCCEYRAGRQRSGCRGRRTVPDLVSGGMLAAASYPFGIPGVMFGCGIFPATEVAHRRRDQERMSWMIFSAISITSRRVLRSRLLKETAAAGRSVARSRSSCVWNSS